MIKAIMTIKNIKIEVCLVLVAILLSGCVSPSVKTALPLDLTQAGGIEIKVDATKANIDEKALAEQTGKNLSTWRYPIASDASATITHRMIIAIGETKYGSTPTGFSFNIGNSDPRALDFQKADVLPITCTLQSVQDASQSAELNMGFSDSAVTGDHPDLKELTDHASTVCFNLLEEIKWPLTKTTNETSSASPSWMPEIRIETETEKVPANNPQVIENESPTPEASNIAPEDKKPVTSEDEPKSVTREINKEGRKVYIIHNQGNPIIFKFGHDR